MGLPLQPGLLWYGPLCCRGAPDTIRTCDLCLRMATLYPAELRAHVSHAIGGCLCNEVIDALAYIFLTDCSSAAVLTQCCQNGLGSFDVRRVQVFGEVFKHR